MTCRAGVLSAALKPDCDIKSKTTACRQYYGNGALEVSVPLTGDDMASTNGTIKRLVHDKGFGFIAASDGSEYFFHQSSCQTPFDELREGQAVTFDKGQGPKGPRGENVRLA